MATGPELLYVNSKITDPKNLSEDLFTRWYNDEHIPDIFKTSGIKHAYRYFTASPNSSKVDRPYLALYPVNEVGFLQSAEFKSIPVLSKMLPGPNGAIFDVADFDTRYYKLLLDRNKKGILEATSNLLIVQLEAPSELKSKNDDQVAEWYVGQYSDSSARIRFLKCYFARQNRLTPDENQLDAPSTYLAIHEVENDSAMKSVADKVALVGRVAEFRLLKAFDE